MAEKCFPLQTQLLREALEIHFSLKKIVVILSDKMSHGTQWNLSYTIASLEDGQPSSMSECERLGESLCPLADRQFQSTQLHCPPTH